MKHLFVPYEIALQLKKKGFYDEDGEFFKDYFPRLGFYFKRRSNGEIIPLNVEFCDTSPDIQQYSRIEDIFPAPLYQQVQDWLREKHGYHVDYCWEMADQESKRVNWWSMISKIGVVEMNDKEDLHDFRTPYEALNEGIKEVLKLIK